MDQPWFETIGRAALYLFFVYVGACLLGFAARMMLGRPGSDSAPASHPAAGPDAPATGASGAAPVPEGGADFPGSWARLFVEYVGNISACEVFAAPVGDRRHNRQARALMDHVKKEVMKRQVSALDAERLMEELREVIRTEGQGPPS